MYINNSKFSEREKEVIGLLLQGKSNKQIALVLGISVSTVEYHLKNVYKKLQVNSRTEAVLRLGKSVGDNVTSELGKSIVEINGETADNGVQPISTRRIPMNKMHMIIGGLLTTALVVVFALTNMPAQNIEVIPTVQASATSVIQLPTEMSLPPTSTPIPPTASSQISVSLQISVIEKIRTDLELPELPLDFIEKTGMTNSPNGGLEVVIYQDTDGRKYSVNPETNQVVEIDARILVPKHGDPITQTFSLEDLKSRAMKYFKATIPNFEHLQSSLQYEEGGKGNVYFFTWYDNMTPSSMSRPFAQIGFHKNGLLFAYYNTLLLNK